MASLEPLPQRILLYELRWQIDRIRNNPAYLSAGMARTEQVSLNRIRRIVEQHPRGMATRRIRHNLGPTRWAWLQEKGLVE